MKIFIFYFLKQGKKFNEGQYFILSMTITRKLFMLQVSRISRSDTPIKAFVPENIGELKEDHSNENIKGKLEKIQSMAHAPVDGSASHQFQAYGGNIAKFAQSGQNGLTTEGLKNLTVNEVRTIAILCLKARQPDALTYLLAARHNTNSQNNSQNNAHSLDLSVTLNSDLTMDSSDLDTLSKWVSDMPPGFVKSLNIANNPLHGGTELQIAETAKKCGIDLITQQPIWCGTLSSPNVNKLRDIFSNALDAKFGRNIISLANATLASSATPGQQSRSSDPISWSPEERETVAAYLHIYSHAMVLLQDAQEAENTHKPVVSLDDIAGEKPRLTLVLTAHPTRGSNPDFAR
ncbi:MAG TPA: hypothetical protein VK832_03800, partial [Burkholderiaceae bacterium]|nr:hypothetical protein [Burkholderiaceae bacterium]